MIKLLALKIARRLLLFAVDESLKRALPKIYAELDVELPFWYRQRFTPAQVEVRVADTARAALKAAPTSTQLELVKLLFDPVEAAVHNMVK